LLNTETRIGLLKQFEKRSGVARRAMWVGWGRRYRNGSQPGCLTISLYFSVSIVTGVGTIGWQFKTTYYISAPTALKADDFAVSGGGTGSARR